MDDHSQPEVRIWSSHDCSAAECVECDRAEVEEPETQPIVPVVQQPFVWQHGRRLLLLEWEMGYWVLAELEFDPLVCRYTESRRAFYRWEREAVGALLSRTIASGYDAAVESAELLDVWIRQRR